MKIKLKISNLCKSLCAKKVIKKDKIIAKVLETYPNKPSLETTEPELRISSPKTP